MKSVHIREGNTGCLHLIGAGSSEEHYVPSYDLDTAIDLLAQFESLLDRDGMSIKDRYWSDGINWFPTTVNHLFGRIFIPYVRYRPLIAEVLGGGLRPVHESRGEFWRITTLLTGGEATYSAKAAAFNALVAWNNRLAVARRRVDVLFFRFTRDDFRTSKAKKALDELHASYLEALIGRRALLASSLCGDEPYYFCGWTCRSNDFSHEYVLDGFDLETRVLFAAAITKMEAMMSAFVREFRQHCETLKRATFRTLYAIDDTQVIYPLLYACQRQGIHAVAHQHGAAYNKRHASYTMSGIEPSGYRWFDTLITWSRFWRDRFLAITECRPPNVVVGCDLFDFHLTGHRASDRLPRNILIPYEFVTNTHQVGRYMAKLMDLGFRVHLKVRSDEDVASQIETYFLAPRYREQLIIVDDLTPELLDGIDIVAGTSSTLVYQLVACQKITWMLETDYRYMEDLVEAGYAHLVRYEDLERLSPGHFERPTIDPAYLASAETLKNTLAREVLRCPN